MRRSFRIASRNFFEMVLAWAISVESASRSSGSRARCSTAFRPYLPRIDSTFATLGTLDRRSIHQASIPKAAIRGKPPRARALQRGWCATGRSRPAAASPAGPRARGRG